MMVRVKQRLVWPFLAAICMVCPTALGVPDALLRAVPADAWLALMIDPAAQPPRAGGEGGGGGALNAAAFLFDQARRMGLTAEVDPELTAAMEIVGSMPVVVRQPFAVCVLGASAKPLSGGGYRLAELRAALIAHTRGRNDAIEARIQHLLARYLNTDVATYDAFTADGVTVHRVLDRRLPDWAQIRWGAVGDHYVFALGPGVFERVAAAIEAGRHGAPSLMDDAWFASAHRRCRGTSAVAEWTVHLDAIRTSLEPIMRGQSGRVVAGLGLGDLERGVWTLGSEGRAVEAYAVLREHNPEGPALDRFSTICRQPDGEWIDRVVPAQARRFAVIEQSARDLVVRGRDAYLASRSQSARANLRRMWARVEQETGVSVERDLLSQLGQRIIIHDDPPAAFGGLSIPLARTVLIEISGSSLAVRTALDRLLRRWQQHLDRPSPDWASLALHHADDGVWYLQAGLYGPALAVTARWIVIGHSPFAVRQNVAFLEGRTPPGTLPQAELRGEQPAP